jgi:excisionase family DNA binding protein
LRNIFFEGINNPQMATLTTNEVAEKLGVSARRVRAMIQAGSLPGEKKGRDYLIKEKDLALVRHRKPGRPKKEGVKGRALRTHVKVQK